MGFGSTKANKFFIVQDNNFVLVNPPSEIIEEFTLDEIQ
jgi:hypothetical protein